MSNLQTQLSHLPDYLGAHIQLCSLALLLGICLSVPLGLLSAHRSRMRWLLLTVTSVTQTIPSLALLALMVPLLGLFGFLPALLALVLYSMLPILRNTVTAIAAVDTHITEAAKGLGMTPGQVLRRVELPLALPIIVAGVRMAAVWVVGTATLSTPVGQASLGNYIFSGLQTRNWTAVLVGCIAAAVLALSVDGLLALVIHGISKRKKRLAVGSTISLVALLAGGSALPLLADSTKARDQAPAVPPAAVHAVEHDTPATAPTLRVGAKTFTEQYILASLLQRVLSDASFRVERSDSLGSAIAFEALRQGDIDVYVDYTGTLYANVLKKQAPQPAWRVMDVCAAELARQYGVRLLGALGFENTYALAVRRRLAQQLGLRSISDLAPKSSTLTLGSDYEFLQRPEWERLKTAYALDFSATRSFDSTFMYDAVRTGEVDVITAFSSDGRIAAYDLLVLQDDRAAFPPYEAVILLSPTAAQNPSLVGALTPLLGAITVETMQQANWMVDRKTDKQTVAQATEWLYRGLPVSQKLE